MKNLKMKKEFKVIADLLFDNSRVLDVGCGDGSLMSLLKKEKNIEVRGLELNQENVQQCLQKGLSVIQGNAETELHQFPDQSFDYVILSQTLQAFMSPENVIKDLLRVGKKVIVTIPNFGHWKVRVDLLFKGEMPITKNLPYEWYNTPNLHMCTIQDFYNFCNNKGINIFTTISLNGPKTSKITSSNLKFKNLISELCIFLLEK